MATIEPRKNRQGQVYGWRVRIRRTGHDQVSKTFDHKQDAERWARQIEHELEADAVSLGSMTLAKLCRDVEVLKDTVHIILSVVNTCQKQNELIANRLSTLSSCTVNDK